MSDPRGFLQISRRIAPYRPVAERLGDHRDLAGPVPAALAVEQARPLHGLRRAVLPQRLPARQPGAGLERARAAGPLARGGRRAARHQQLPRADRQAVPGTVRGGLRAVAERRPGDDQADRAGDRRAGVRRGLGRAAAGRPCERPADRRHRLRPGRAGGRPAAGARRPRGDGVRARRPSRRPAAVRHPRLQAREVDGRSHGRPAGGEGVCFELGVEAGIAPTLEQLRAEHDAVLLATGAQRHRDLELPGRELGGRGAGDGLSDRPQPRAGRAAPAGGGDGGRPPRGHPGRWRHQRRLPGKRASGGRAERDRGGARADAAGVPLAAGDVAGVAPPAPRPSGPPRGRRAAVGARDGALRRRARPGGRDRRHPGGRRPGGAAAGRPGAPGHRLRRGRGRAADRAPCGSGRGAPSRSTAGIPPRCRACSPPATACSGPT